jgi:hypothetical protein
MWIDAEEWSISVITFTTIFAVIRVFKISCGALVYRQSKLQQYQSGYNLQICLISFASW